MIPVGLVRVSLGRGEFERGLFRIAEAPDVVIGFRPKLLSARRGGRGGKANIRGVFPRGSSNVVSLHKKSKQNAFAFLME